MRGNEAAAKKGALASDGKHRVVSCYVALMYGDTALPLDSVSQLDLVGDRAELALAAWLWRCHFSDSLDRQSSG